MRIALVVNPYHCDDLHNEVIDKFNSLNHCVVFYTESLKNNELVKLKDFEKIVFTNFDCDESVLRFLSQNKKDTYFYLLNNLTPNLSFFNSLSQFQLKLGFICSSKIQASFMEQFFDNDQIFLSKHFSKIEEVSSTFKKFHKGKKIICLYDDYSSLSNLNISIEAFNSLKKMFVPDAHLVIGGRFLNEGNTFLGRYQELNQYFMYVKNKIKDNSESITVVGKLNKQDRLSLFKNSSLYINLGLKNDEFFNLYVNEASQLTNCLFSNWGYFKELNFANVTYANVENEKGSLRLESSKIIKAMLKAFNTNKKAERKQIDNLLSIFKKKLPISKKQNSNLSKLVNHIEERPYSPFSREGYIATYDDYFLDFYEEFY